ncbi:MAG: hypothetical protein Q9177_003846 [Variospora cf. flavescens]
MTRPSPRLTARLNNPNLIFSQPSSRHVCLQCRYRAALQQAPSRRLISPYPDPLLQRTYATGALEEFQEKLSEGMRKRVFRDGQGSPPDEPLKPPRDDTPVDDIDYKPAVSGEELERVGGPSGWWEEAWDEEHQFVGYMRPTPLRQSIQVQAAIERALVEAILLDQEPRDSPLRSTIERLLREAGQLTRKDKDKQRRPLVLNFRRPSDVPDLQGFRLAQADDGTFKLDWTRQEERDKLCSFLETSAKESIVVKEPEEVKAEEEIDWTKQENRDRWFKSQETSTQEDTVAKEQADSLATSNNTSAVEDIDEPRIPKAWDTPEEVEVGTQPTTGDPSINEGPVRLDTSTEPLVMEIKKKSFPNFEGVIRLSDDAIKFAVIKRAMQLTGTRIPDPAIQSIETINDLHRAMKHKPKPKKLADHLTQPRRNEEGISLAKLPNVELLPTRHRHAMAEAALGRQKVIEKRLDEYGIQEPWKEAMEQIEAYERRRLKRHRDRSKNATSGLDSVGGLTQRGALVRGGVDPNVIEADAIERGIAREREALG